MSNLSNNNSASNNNLNLNSNSSDGNGHNHNNNNNNINRTRESCLLRCASQSSLDESSQKIPRQRSTTGTYKNDGHTNRSFDTMNEMRKQNLLCDVVLIADGMEIPAHKLVLASSSSYFYAMFSGFEESRQDRITIQGVDYQALQLLVEYVYTSIVEVTEDNVQMLLTAANLLQLTDVREACCDYLQSQLDPSNCLGIREFADIHGCVDLFNYADSYIEQHFSEVIQFEEFLNLSADQVEAFVRSDSLSIPSEEKIFECVIAWIQNDPLNRQSHLGRLMQHVRLPLLSEEYILQRVDKEPLLQDDLQCKNFIIEALKYHLMKKGDKLIFSFNTPRTIPRRPVSQPKVLLVIGGQAPKAIRSVECYDLREEKWYQAAELPSRRCRAGVAVLGDKVYAVGGFNGSLRVRTVDVYDPMTDSWTACCSMEARRSTLGVAVLNNFIYAVGGFDGSTGLSSAEMFDPTTQEWRMITPMSTRRSSVGVCVLNGLLYAVGGYDGSTRQCLASVEAYNPVTNSWASVADMSARRSGAGVGVLNNMIWCCGGHDGPLVRKSVECFNPETNSWRQVSDMAYCRRNAGVVAFGGLLYVIGGDDGTSNLQSVEVYHPESDSWRILPASMNIGRSYAGFQEQQQQQQPQHQQQNHYENVDVAQHVGVIPAQQPNEPNVAQIVNLQNRPVQPVPAPCVQQYHPPYRNDIYDRSNNAAYDIPRNVRNQNFYANLPNNGAQRRSNLHLDIRQRCPSVNHQHQRSFDDTESCYYGSNASYNTYERIRDEPVYQNSAASNSMYQRLDVIGTGIGRIERHLSSSCGNIDHYNVGGHYAVVSHSHLNSVMMNQNQMNSGSSQNSREGVKSLFSCLGGENSQSMSSINDSETSQSQNSASSSIGMNQQQQQQQQRSTGAIPKTKSKQSNKVSPKPIVTTSSAVVSSSNAVSTAPPIPPPISKANFSKSSLQYLLMNKWLPLGPDYKIIDFNFMFSRNCSSSDHCNAAEGVVQFNGQAEMVEPGMYQAPTNREYPMMNNGQYPRVIRNTPQLSRLRESDAENVQYENIQRGRENAFRARSESPSFNGPRHRVQQDDPFRNWSFNFENNSFRPAGAANAQQRDVRRITDGTLPSKDFQEQNPRKELPVVMIEQDQQQHQNEPQPSTSKSSSPSTSENSNQCCSTSSSSTGAIAKTGEMKKSENYDNLASLQQDPLPSNSTNGKQRKKKSTESQSSDSVTLAEEDEDNEEDNDDPFDELESDID
ncbi:hypothetical protein PVAND_006027 [Polypedilum vanderplanki]|uniref:BTB domain-containing protein n=1 Tax=Polypedilum vanderplanki TaxID=319348 RepID=A0A9J6C2D0_POLVA|nr:hypothetical protein PVAND_006027 [Polypedilum vanderplanki]